MVASMMETQKDVPTLSMWLVSVALQLLVSLCVLASDAKLLSFKERIHGRGML